MLRQEPWLGWVVDLSKPDALIDFGGPLVDFPLLSAMTSFNLLPLDMVVLWVLHQKSMPTPTDPQQAQMQKMMTWMRMRTRLLKWTTKKILGENLFNS